jgi:hypothetical protein
VARRLGHWPLFLAAITALVLTGAAVAACERPPEPSVDAYCRDIANAEGLDESLADFDPDTLAPRVAALRKASKVAPADIAPQVRTLLDLATALQTTIDTARTDQAAAMEQTLRDHADELDAVTEAGQTVEAYTRDNCGIELNSTAVPTSTGR